MQDPEKSGGYPPPPPFNPDPQVYQSAVDSNVYQAPPPGPFYSSQPPEGFYPPPVGQPHQQAYYQTVQQQPGNMVVLQGIPYENPPDNFVLALMACLFCDAFCLGLAALICAIQSRSAADNGFTEDARRKGETAKSLSIAALVTTVVMVAIIVGIYIFVFLSIAG